MREGKREIQFGPSFFTSKIEYRVIPRNHLKTRALKDNMTDGHFLVTSKPF